MRQRLCIVLACILLLSGCALREAPAETERESRIVATSAALCTITDRLEIELAGVPDTESEIPERYKDSVKTGLPMTPDLEIIKSLKPTDVLIPSSLQYDLQPKFAAAGLPATFVNLSSLEGMFRSIKQLGEKYGKQEQADALYSEYTGYMDEYNKRIADYEKPRVLVLMDIPGAYMVAAEKSYVGNLVKHSGGINVFEGESEAFLNVSTEELLQRGPDVILLAAHGMPDEVTEYFKREFEENSIWKHFDAVQNGRVYNLDYKKFNMSASLFYQEALDDLFNLLYKESE